MSNIIIYHNPKCKTSRDVLEMIRKTGIEPNVVHQKNPLGALSDRGHLHEFDSFDEQLITNSSLN